MSACFRNIKAAWHTTERQKKTPNAQPRSATQVLHTFASRRGRHFKNAGRTWGTTWGGVRTGWRSGPWRTPRISRRRSSCVCSTSLWSWPSGKGTRSRSLVPSLGRRWSWWASWSRTPRSWTGCSACSTRPATTRSTTGSSSAAWRLSATGLSRTSLRSLSSSATTTAPERFSKTTWSRCSSRSTTPPATSETRSSSAHRSRSLCWTSSASTATAPAPWTTPTTSRPWRTTLSSCSSPPGKERRGSARGVS